VTAQSIDRALRAIGGGGRGLSGRNGRQGALFDVASAAIVFRRAARLPDVDRLARGVWRGAVPMTAAWGGRRARTMERSLAASPE